MTYQDALNCIQQKQSLGIQPGLQRVQRLLDKMGNPQNELKIIHIAGTNGKGSVAYTIANALTKNGCKTGLFTSPWLIDYREQIQIDGTFISEESFARYVADWQDNDCTEFEMLTAIMYRYFADEKVDYAVVECGMGGAGDATNTEQKNLAVITAISLDHTDFLGDTLDEIAAEKAGILRKDCPCVLYPNPSLEPIFAARCSKLITVPETGNYLTNNLDTAVCALKELGFDGAVNYITPPARQTEINGVLLDGGHNVGAAKALLPILQDKSETALIGMMRDKDMEGYLALIAPKCKRIITTTVTNPRAASAVELKAIAAKYCDNVSAIDNPREALKEKPSLICGSFYLIREIIKFL